MIETAYFLIQLREGKEGAQICDLNRMGPAMPQQVTQEPMLRDCQALTPSIFWGVSSLVPCLPSA